jgi:hypothetical protein
MASDDVQAENLGDDDSFNQMLRRDRLRRAAARLGGSLASIDIPGWESTESTVEWVRSLRHESDIGLDKVRDS